MVDQIRGDIDKIHQGRLQGAANLLGGFAFHGFRCALPAPLGGHLCMKVSFRKEKKIQSLMVFVITHTGVLQPPSLSLQFLVTESREDIPVEPATSHTAVESGFNWTALTIIWAHGDYSCHFTSKGGFVLVVLLRSCISDLEQSHWFLVTVVSLPKRVLKVHCDMTSGSNQIIQLLRHSGLFMVCVSLAAP